MQEPWLIALLALQALLLISVILFRKSWNFNLVVLVLAGMLYSSSSVPLILHPPYVISGQAKTIQSMAAAVKPVKSCHTQVRRCLNALERYHPSMGSGAFPSKLNWCHIGLCIKWAPQWWCSKWLPIRTHMRRSDPDVRVVQLQRGWCTMHSASTSCWPSTGGASPGSRTLMNKACSSARSCRPLCCSPCLCNWYAPSYNAFYSWIVS